MANGEIGLVKGTVLAAHQAILKLAVVHSFHQVEGPRAELHAAVALLLTLVIVVAVPVVMVLVPVVVVPAVTIGRGRRCERRQRRECGCLTLSSSWNLQTRACAKAESYARDV
jgi:hypothetical protein